MRVEIVSPCCLHLGFARTADGMPSELSIALQHPPIQLTAQSAQSLNVSGARADVAYHVAEDYFAQLGVPASGQIEIELAIPAFMGLGSNGMLRVSIEHALRWLTKTVGLRTTFDPFRCAFTQGGLSLINQRDGLVRRAEVAHTNEVDDWVFVLVLPRTPDDIADNFEQQRHEALRRSSVRLASSRTADVLFDAVARDDFDAFSNALAVIHAINQEALVADGHHVALHEQERDVIEHMLANGATFATRVLIGLGLFGLIKGGPASRTLRQSLVQRLGYFGPRVLASICDNYGARVITHES